MPSHLRRGVVVSKADLNLSPQVNTVLHKHKGFHGSLYVGLSEYTLTPSCGQWRVDHSRSWDNLTL